MPSDHGVLGKEHVVAGIAKMHAKELAHQLVVLHDEDGRSRHQSRGSGMPMSRRIASGRNSATIAATSAPLAARRVSMPSLRKRILASSTYPARRRRPRLATVWKLAPCPTFSDL